MATDNPPPKFSEGPQSPDEVGSPIFDKADYKPILTNWFTAKPYGFRFTSKDEATKMVMYLPIGPSNINIVTNFATNITSTLYGTVEEHSPVRYYDIMIEGTTGMVPKYVNPVDAGLSITPNVGRTAFAIQQTFSTQAAGFFANTIQTAENVIKSARNLINGLSGVSSITGVQLDQTGYYAFHNLYRFLLKYKKNASGADDSSGQLRKTKLPPLVFFNYKDNNEYSVVIRNFVLRRDKNDPMLYYYSINMRGYDLTEINTSGNINRNASVSDLQSSLGLDGVKGSTFLSDAKNVAAQSKSILSSVANGLNQLGR